MDTSLSSVEEGEMQTKGESTDIGLMPNGELSHDSVCHEEKSCDSPEAGSQVLASCETTELSDLNPGKISGNCDNSCESIADEENCNDGKMNDEEDNTCHKQEKTNMSTTEDVSDLEVRNQEGPKLLKEDQNSEDGKDNNSTESKCDEELNAGVSSNKETYGKISVLSSVKVIDDSLNNPYDKEDCGIVSESVHCDLNIVDKVNTSEEKSEMKLNEKNIADGDKTIMLNLTDDQDIPSTPKEDGKIWTGDKENKFDNSNCDLLVFNMKESSQREKSDFKCFESSDKKDVNVSQSLYTQPIFEDITEDEDSEGEQFENIELELDDLIDTPDTVVCNKGSDKVLEDNNDHSKSENDFNSSNASSVINGTVACTASSENVRSVDSVNGMDIGKQACDKDGTENKPGSLGLDQGKPVMKKKSTARKSGKPIRQLESAPLKRINMHPIKNVTMNISEVESALKFDLDYAKKIKKLDSPTSLPKTESSLGNTYKVISVTKSNMNSMKKKRKKKGYDFPGCKKKKRSRLSDDVASSGASSIGSVSLSENDFVETDSISSQSCSAPLSDNNRVVDNPEEPTPEKTPPPALSVSLPISSSPSPSSVSPLSSVSSSSSSKSTPGKGSNKMKSVLEMLHERNRLKATSDSSNIGKGPVTTTTTTTIMVSPPPNKPILEGVKRKGTPRKRRDEVICVSDDDDDDIQYKTKGKRSLLESYGSSTSSTTTSITESSAITSKAVTSFSSTSIPAPVVMMVTQHSTNPGLRSLLPRNMIVSGTSGHCPTGFIRPPVALPGAPPGSLLTPLPLVSTLPAGMKAVSMASLPGGVTAIPLSSLPPGSTIFTAVQGNPNTPPIPGATLVNITPPKAPKSTSSKVSTPSSTTSSTSLTSSRSSKSSKSKQSLISPGSQKLATNSAQANSESLRALLVGKPYTLAHLVPPQSSTASSIVSNTPVVYQMLNNKNSTASGLTTLIPVPSGHQPPPHSLVQQSVPPTSSVTTISKSSTPSIPCYSVIKPYYSVLPPNGVSCLTPPKTPDTDSSSEVAVAASLTRPVGVGGQYEDNDVIPLCCCKITVPTFNKMLTGVTYCQALDSVDNKVLGCCNKVTNNQLVRPGVKIPFMAVCEGHRKRLALHQCCPGCGHFCSQGKFQQCHKDGTSSTHHFHKQCMFYRGGKQFCPHCGEETSQSEVELLLKDDGTSSGSPRVPSRLSKNKENQKKARIVAGRKKKTATDENKAFTLPNKKSIDPSVLPVGPDQATLTRLCKCIGDDRPKKYRTLPKDLYVPASEGDMDKVFYLLMDGMDPNVRQEDDNDQTALHAAATSGSLGTVFVLEQFGAEIHAQDRSLQTPLMCASENGHAKVVQFLLKAGAKVEDRGEDGMTSLHYAAKAGHLEVLRLLLNTRKLDVNVQDDGGWTPIIWATESMLPDIVHFLISHGGDPNKKDNEENTGLHWSAYSGSVEIAEMFLDLGSELDTPNEHGDRPLHIAARQDHYDIVVHLLARGADVDVKNHKNETPVDACVNKTGQVSMALKINQQLRGLAAYKLIHPERLLERDITMGREKNPIACVNKEDDEHCPSDYLYIIQNVETSPLNINNVITGLQSCRCKDDCSSLYCVCARSSVCCWYDKSGRLLEEFNLLEPPLLFECNRACRCWVNCNNRVVQNGVVCRLQLFRTNGRGWGVRALMDIPKGTFVCEYIGELISDSEADRREDDSYLFDLDNKDGDTYCIDARKYGNIARFINHLCEPNLVPVKVFVEHQDLRFPRICFFSSREIKAYEELGFDYGEKFWIIKWKQFTCACQSAKCKYSTDTIQKTLDDYKLRYPDEPAGLDAA